MSNQDKLRKLLKDAGVTQSQAAAYIAEETKRPCSVRAVRSWLASDVASARGCPDWAVEALKTRLIFHKKLVV